MWSQYNEGWLMSPDDVFAAQFWPWPDPAIKRDMEGRILFVNAAFLALYGGRVEDWRGNAVGGWPAPQHPTGGQIEPYRFETRLPDQLGAEQVYDWIEQPLADGDAFALARNVTIFTQSPDPEPVATQPIPPQTGYEAPPAAQHAQAADAVLAQHQPAEQACAVDTHMAPPVAEAPEFQAPVAAPAQEAPAAPAATPPIAAAAAATLAAAPEIAAPAVPEIEIPNIQIPSDDNYALTQPVEENVQAAAPAVDTAPAPTQEVTREFERRALPIEDDSAVLGNNWRDAVIAKAVGADEVAPQAVVEESPAAEEASPPEASASDGQIHILLAEDNAINALLTRTLLEAEGHTVETVEDGALAVEAMRTGKYDLIFMDMRMPNMDGLEATRKIRAMPNVSKNLPIIALTANAFDDDRNACFDSGMNDFMTKPVSAEELSEMVSEWTGEKAQQRMAS